MALCIAATHVHASEFYIDHQFCPNCGCAPFGFGTDKQDNATAAVNVRCLEGVDLATLTRVPVDGRSF